MLAESDVAHTNLLIEDMQDNEPEHKQSFVHQQPQQANNGL